jgi:hypothetical protein
MKRLLILIHRYLGIPLSIMFVIWFVSGIVMIYTGGLPAIAREERLARMTPVDTTRIEYSHASAWTAAGMRGSPSEIQLTSVLDRPAWRFDASFGRALIIFADNADVLEEVSPEQAAAAAAEYLDVPPMQIEFERTLLEADQWTLSQPGDLPLYLFSVDDGASTQIYISVLSGEVALVTNRTSRFLAWVGVIPHWLYFTPLRVNQPVWYWIVVALAALGCLLAAIGLMLAVTQFRRSRPFSFAKSIRYRGWMRWHYYSGALFGLFALTWVFSGLLSMEPFGWTRATGLEMPRSALTGGDIDIDAFADVTRETEAAQMLAELDAVEVDFVQILASPYFAVQQKDRRTLVHASTLVPGGPFDTQQLLRAVEREVGDVRIKSAELLDTYDSYYYARNAEAPLPVLRIKFSDPYSTWYYINPAEARIVARTNRYSRIERWLFNGLHSLDFAFWYDKRPLWDVGMIVLSLGALLTSAIGMCLGLRRLLPAREIDDVIE